MFNIVNLSFRIQLCLPFILVSFSSWQLECGICFEIFLSDKLHAAACGHPFCVSCWEGLFYCYLDYFETHSQISCLDLTCNLLFFFRRFQLMLVHYRWVIYLTFPFSLGYITTAINDGPGCLTLRCPDPSCRAAVGQDMINLLAPDKDRQKYTSYFVRSYVEDNRKVS